MADSFVNFSTSSFSFPPHLLLLLFILFLLLLPFLPIPPAHLSSNQLPTRHHALALVSALAKQCSDLGPVKSMLEQLFTALKSESVSNQLVSKTLPILIYVVLYKFTNFCLPQ